MYGRQGAATARRAISRTRTAGRSSGFSRRAAAVAAAFQGSVHRHGHASDARARRPTEARASRHRAAQHIAVRVVGAGHRERAFATQSADQAVRLAERAVFLTNHMPFLLRLQARVGVDELLGDAAGRLRDVQRTASSRPNLRPALQEAVELGKNSEAAIHELRLLYQQLEPTSKSPQIVPGGQRSATSSEQVTYRDLAHLLQSSHQLADRSLELTKEVHGARLSLAQPPLRHRGADSSSTCGSRSRAAARLRRAERAKRSR